MLAHLGATGKHEGFPTYVAIKVLSNEIHTACKKLISSQGTVFDVTGNKAYGPEGSYKGRYSS